MALTANGELLLPVVREFLRQEDRIFELSAEMNGLLIGSVSIAAYSSIATHWLPSVIREFQRDYPNVKIKLMEGIWQEVSQWLDERVADIGFLSYQENMPYDWIPLAEDPMLALLPMGSPAGGGGGLSAGELRQRIVSSCRRWAATMTWEALFIRGHIEPNICYTTLESFSAMSMVEQGLGVSVMNRLITRKRVCDIAHDSHRPAGQYHTGRSAALPDGHLAGGEDVPALRGADADEKGRSTHKEKRTTSG